MNSLGSKKGKLWLNQSTGDWDRNFSANAVEVVDTNQRPVFQMIRKRANLIQLSGLFVSSKGTVFDVRPAKPLFKYPSWRHLGEYAEEAKEESTQPLSELPTSELRSRAAALCNRIRALGNEWDDGYYRNNEKTRLAISKARNKEEEQKLGQKRMEDNQHLYHDLEARYNRDFGPDARLLKTELSKRVNSPTEVFNPVPVPPLLKSGVAAGPNPFNDVADYLEGLARRL